VNNSFVLSLLASAADGLGVPGANHLAHYLDPPTFGDWIRETALNWIRETAQNLHLTSHRSTLTNYRTELEDLVLAVAGHDECPELVACTAAKYAARLPGSGAWSYLLGSQTSGLPHRLVELVNVFRFSVMLGDDCRQYRCRKDDTRLIQPRKR